ncbi:MAG: hypothetical protein PHV28_09320 [Kiritimatiellae bacterium]|nr:hypothetical protein [Kiritimatiellia bacterium]
MTKQGHYYWLSYAAGLSFFVTNRVTRYWGGDTVTEKFWDGKWTRETRSAFYDGNGCRVETVVTESSDYPAVTNSVTVRDFLGRAVFVATPLGVTSNFYEGASDRIVRVSRTGSPDTLYGYDELGNETATALDVDGDGQVSHAGTDRISSTVTRYEEDTSNVWWRVTTSEVWAYTNSAASVTSSVDRVRMTGLGTPAPTSVSENAILTAQRESVDWRGNVTRASTYTDAGAATVWTVTEMPGSVQPEIQKTVAGHTVSMVSSTAVTNTYAYDGFGRRVSATDGRGNTAVTAYNELGQIAYTEDAASNRTSYAYDASGRQNAVTDPLNNTTRTAYDSLGNVIARWGATYPVAYEYDTAGRKTAMYTYRGAGEITDYNSFQSLVSSLDKTVWLYDQPTGLLTNKVFVDDSRVRYTYMEGGRLATRVWARGAVTEYSYDALGQLTNVNYGGSAPGVAYAYDRLGRMLSAISPASYSLYTYTGLALTEEIQDGWLFTRPSDGLGRGAGYALHTPDDHNSPAHSVEYGHNALGQFSFVCSAHSAVSNTFGYAYLDGTDMHEGYTASVDTPFLAVAKAYEPDRGLIASVTNSVLSVPFVVSSFVYANNAIGHRLSRVDSGSVTNLFTNNGRGEVTEAVMGAGTYAYGYDDIGNRVFSALDTVTNTYTANSLNQYTQVNGGMSASPAYDLDGNMTFDGVFWHHSWDAENRLVMSEPYGLATNGAVRLNYQYNHRNLQIAKMTERLSGRGAGYPMDPSQPGTWDAVETRRYVWDGYNIAAEIVIDEVTPSTNVTYYTWGLDLSGTLQGAGGVGGLLAETKMTASTTNTYYAFGDANGNVTEYADATGTVRGHYEYSPFGEVTAQSGDMADNFTHRFSTKPLDSETGQVRYQLRPYKPFLGWLQRDSFALTRRDCRW